MFERNCPICNSIIVYKNKRKYNDSCRKNTNCRSCSKKGSKNPMFGKLGIENPNYGQERESIKGDNNPSKRKDVRDKISLKNKGKKSGMLNKNHTTETIEKIRKSNSGKIRSSETIEKIREARKNQKGDKCPGWKGGITPIVKRLRNSDEYKIWRICVFTRDEFLCRKCNKGGNLIAHHIIGVSINIDLIFDTENGITLCKECHDEFHFTYGRKNFPSILEIYNLFKV